MTIGSKEWYDLIEQFEKDIGKFIYGMQFEKEDLEKAKMGHVYCHGMTNGAFIAYRLGYSFGKSKYNQ